MQQIHVGLAEYVTIHADGTMTVVRGWISFWKVPKLPFEAALYAFVVLPRDTPPGSQSFVATVRDPGGFEVRRIEGEMNVQGGEGFQGGFPIGFTAARTGTYEVVVETGAQSGSATVRFEVAG